MERETTAQQIEQRLRDVAGIYAAVEEHDGMMTLSGKVTSAEQRETATELVRQLAPDHRVDNDLVVVQVAPRSVDDLDRDEPASGLIPDELAELHEDDQELVPDFTNQPLVTDPIPVIENGRETYFPTTDPVITVSPSGDIEVLGGLEATSDADLSVAASTLDNVPGDEAIADAVRRELREDAATTALRIEVEVRRGIVVLRGTVTDLDDAENAEAVASRVEGVVEVREELAVREV